ncbi:MAG: molecular chaperone TorD family protein [Pseudomonadota bacterium]|nr:molecular chaperone TorD family protein [Pseudomonadota bacterium]
MSDTAQAGAGTAVPFPIAPEDQARANFYALLSRLYAGAPDGPLLKALAGASALATSTVLDDQDALAATVGTAWDRLRAASSVMDPDAALQEYTDLFIGVGRSEVNLHASHWITGFMMDKPLVEVRSTLSKLGLGRRADAINVEDHLAAIFETMRILVAGFAGRPPAPADDQQQFFDRHIAPWIERCCSAITSNSVANYYARVAEFTQSFVALERESFAMA